MIIKVVTLDELRGLLKVYRQRKGMPILIGVRDLKRLIVAAVAIDADAAGLVRKLGGDGWVVLSPSGGSESVPAGIDVKGEIRRKCLHARFDGSLILEPSEEQLSAGR